VLESISQIDGQIVVKIFGDDSNLLQTKIVELLHLITPVQGVGRAFVDRAGRIHSCKSKSTGNAAARYGLNVATSRT